MAELGAELLADEVAARGFVGGCWDICAAGNVLADESHEEVGGGGSGGFAMEGFVVGIDAQGAFFVDVCVSVSQVSRVPGRGIEKIDKPHGDQHWEC